MSYLKSSANVRSQSVKKPTTLWLATALAAALTLSMSQANAELQVPTPDTAPVATNTTSTLPSLTELIRENRDAVVHISVEGARRDNQPDLGMFGLPDGVPEELQRFFRQMPRQMPNPRPRSSMGSGFIISPDGYIVTNAHVIDRGDKITVTLSDKRELEAKLIGTDSYSDVALIKVDANALPTVELGNSDSLEVGQWVVAIGAPFGLDFSATQGIVSALSRSLPDGTYVPFIQTDVAVNPGNSGGPLFDLNGKVVGVNSQIYSRSGGYMGISFAIPSNLVQNITQQLRANGEVSRGWLGVGIQNLDQALANSFGMQRPYGALVSSVSPASPADKAGVQAGDIIIDFNNNEVSSANHLPLLVGSTPVGSAVSVTVLRQGAEKKLNVTVEQLASSGNASTALASANSDASELGIAVSELSADERAKANLGQQGVKVEQVRANSPAERAGLQVGDVIISIDNEMVTSPTDLKNKVSQSPEDKPLALLILRNDQKRFVAITRS